MRVQRAMGWLIGCVVIVAGASLGGTTTWTGTGDWFANSGNWNNGLPSAGDEAIIASGLVVLTNSTPDLGSFTMSGGTLIFSNWNTVLSATNVTIQNGATVTHFTNSAVSTNTDGQWVPDARVFIVCTNMTIEMGGKIDVTGRGFMAGKGPGYGVGYGGAAHSGPGCRSFNSFLTNPAYNDPAAPEKPGSGGGTASANSRAGGGAVRLIVGDQLVLNGSILADGVHSGGTHGGGGSGGAVWITCRTIAGATNGLISVNGGNGNFYAAPACGGRIALAYDPEAQANMAEPSAPIRFQGIPGFPGPSAASERKRPDMGTLHLPDALFLAGPFSQKRFHHVQVLIPGFTNWNTGSLTLNDCVLGLPMGLSLDVAGSLVLTNSAQLHFFAAATSGVSEVEYGGIVSVSNDLRLYTNCWIMPYAHPTNGGIYRFEVGGDLAIAAGGGFDADDKGYQNNLGPGAGWTNGNYNGGGYGGIGGAGFYGTVQYGPSYGRAEGPVQAGSGGWKEGGGWGGGAIVLDVRGNAVIHGWLSARGEPGLPNHQGGGSGGGIELHCQTLQGGNSGLLRAEGGYGVYYGANGGGGRIVLRYDTTQQGLLSEQPAVRFSAFAFRANTHVTNEWSYFGEPGTLYLPDALLFQSQSGDVVLDRFRLWHTVLIFSNRPSLWAINSLWISNSVVEFPAGFSLAVTGNVVLTGGGVMPTGQVGVAEGRLTLRAHATNGTLYGSRLDIGGKLFLRTNGWIYPLSVGTNGAGGRTNLLVGIFVREGVQVDSGGGVNADGGGSIPVAGNANGPGAGRNSGSGGGYGGQGGGTAGGYTYGLAAAPFEVGSPGGVFTLYNSGKGGGSVHIVCGGDIVVNGTLTADGYHGAYYGGNGASGGSVFLCGWRVLGSGLLQAKGGAKGSQSVAGDGGGGRIAVWHRFPWVASIFERIENRQTTGLLYSPTLETFNGTLSVAPLGTNAFAGTIGFWRAPSLHGTVIMLR